MNRFRIIAGAALGAAAPELVAAAVLTIALALVTDVIVVALQRLVTPWTRVRQ